MVRVDSVFHTEPADVLVIGSGGAGLRAAIQAARGGVHVLLATRGVLGRGGNSPMGRFSFCVSLPENGDSPDAHMADTLASGEELADEPLVRTLVENAPARLADLVGWGMRFDRIDGRLKQTHVPGHRAARACSFHQETGLEIVRTLRRQLSRTPVRVLEDCFVVALLADAQGIGGALAVDIWSGDLLLIEAAAVVLATGGVGRLFSITSNAADATGDGYALAYGVGAELVDMEMIQFHPCGLVDPPPARGATDPGGALLTAGAWLLNGRGERFMARYDPDRLEFSTRSTVTRAIAEELLAGRGTPAGGVWLRLPPEAGRESQSRVLGRSWSDYLRKSGLDPDAGPLEVAPTSHSTMGGVRIDGRAETTVAGLFAAGEVAGGVHGANRLAGNGLTEAQVFGALAGGSAALHARAAGRRRLPDAAVREAADAVTRGIGSGALPLPPWRIKEALAATMTAGGGVIRDRASLETAMDRVRGLAQELAQSAPPRPGLQLQEALEARSMLLVAEMVLHSALRREESRGAHFRSDFPTRDDSGPPRHTTVRRGGEGSMAMGWREAGRWRS